MFPAMLKIKDAKTGEKCCASWNSVFEGGCLKEPVNLLRFSVAIFTGFFKGCGMFEISTEISREFQISSFVEKLVYRTCLQRNKLLTQAN